MLTRASAFTVFLFGLGLFACTPALRMPKPGDHYRGAAAAAMQTNNGLDDNRIAFDIDVREAKPDGSYKAAFTVTEARRFDDGAAQNSEALIGKTVVVSFDTGGRLQEVVGDGLDEATTLAIANALGALNATGSVSPVDLRTIKNDRPRQSSLPVGDNATVVATFRNEGSQRTPHGAFNVVGISGEQSIDILLDATHSTKAQVRVSGQAKASMRDVLLGETRVVRAMEYLDETADAQAVSGEAKPMIAWRSESYVNIIPASESASVDALADGEGLFSCSERVAGLATRIQAMAPLYSAGDTSVPQIAGELVQYAQDSGPRVVLGPEGTYVVDANGTRGAVLDRDQLGQALAQAMPQSEHIVVYVDADQSVQTKVLLEVAATLREMKEALEVKLEGRLLVGARTIKLPDTVSYPRLRDEASSLEGAPPSLRLGLVPQILREELGRTCYAGFRASAESFAVGVPLGSVRRAVPGLVASCGCQGVDSQFVDGWLGLFDARVLGSGWIPLPQGAGGGKTIKLGRRATVGDLAAQIEQLGLPPNDIALVKITIR